MKNNLITLLVLSILVSACNNKSSNDEAKNYQVQGDTILLTDNSNIKTHIKTITVAEEAFRLELISAGTVKAIPNNYAEIAPPFAGRVLNRMSD